MKLLAVQLLAVVLAVPLAQCLHELTHYWTAGLLGVPAHGELRFWRAMTITYDASRYSGRQRALYTSLIDTAPTILGALLAVLWLLVGMPAADSLWLVALGLAWAFYTLPSRTDLTANYENST